MKKFLAPALLLAMTTIFAAPAARPVSSVKKQLIPCEFTDSGSRWAFFKVILPLPKGELFDLSNLQMLDAGGKDIPLYVRISSRWQDGSFQWLLLRGYISLPKIGYRKVQIQYGSQVLRPLVRQVIQVESEAMWQFSTGVMEMQLSKTAAPLPLPADIRIDGSKAGGFNWKDGSIPKEFAAATPVVSSRDNITVIAYHTPNHQQPVLQCRIYRDSSRIEFSGALVQNIVFTPHPGSKFAVAADGSGTFDFRTSLPELLKDKNAPLYGKIPAPVLLRSGALPRIAPEAINYPWFKDYKQQWFKQLESSGTFGEYALAYFAGGNSKFLHQAQKLPLDTTFETAFYAYITGISDTPAVPPAASVPMSAEAAQKMLTAQDEIQIEQCIPALHTLRKRNPELFRSGVDILLRALNQNDLRWHSHSNRYAGYGTLLDSKFNFQAAALLLAAANMDNDRNLYLQTCQVIQRAMIDGNAYILLYHSPELFSELTKWYAAHPGEKPFTWEKKSFLKKAFERREPAFDLSFFDKRTWYLQPGAGVDYFLLDISRTSIANSRGMCRLHIFTASGQELRTMTLPRVVKNTSLMLTLPANAAKAVIEDDQSGSWDLRSLQAKVAIEADNRWLRIADPALKKFSFVLPEKTPYAVIRFSGLNAHSFVELLTPSGKILRPVKNSIAVTKTEKGTYQLYIHSSQPLQLAFDRAKVKLFLK